MDTHGFLTSYAHSVQMWKNKAINKVEVGRVNHVITFGKLSTHRA